MTHKDSSSSLSKIGQWHLIAFFSQKIISVKTRYKTYDKELLTIIKTFKTWRYYLEGCKYNIFVFTNHNNFYQFMDIKSLSFYQVRLAKELS